MTGPIQALMPIKSGRQFVFYGDSCSGVPGALHEEKLAKVNSVVRRLNPQPEFIIFPGDEVIGLVPNEDELRQQWAHFFDVEMAWLDRDAIPIFHATGNHTTYNTMSERVFADVMPHHPRNGPPDQKGLSYFVRDGDLLLVFVHTLWSGLGGEGHVELTWLEKILRDHSDARWKFVIGHHPAIPVNGYVGTYQRCIGDEYVSGFWSMLEESGVVAYLCSHILAFDVQCRGGVLQITSAGAGTAHRMPEEIEFLHCVQMVVDERGLRYQVIDEDANIREQLVWPPVVPKTTTRLSAVKSACPFHGPMADVALLKIKGKTSAASSRQTIVAALEDSDFCPLWIGLVGKHLQLTVVLQPQKGRSPHQWLGPCFSDGDDIDIEVLLHPDMGPGGILWRKTGTEIWTGFTGLSAWGANRLIWPDRIIAGSLGINDKDARFVGGQLDVFLGSSQSMRKANVT